MRQPDASNSLVHSSLAILVRQPHRVQKHNVLCQISGQRLTLKNSSYQRCMSKRYHYLLDNKDAVCRLCQPLFWSHSHCFGGLRKKTPNLTFSVIFFEFAYMSKILNNFMFLISINFNKTT
jgi:hypothetical protein